MSEPSKRSTPSGPRKSHDAVVVGSGPNGLAAAIALVRAGHSVLVVEARDTLGGGCRSAELTLPDFTHDVCSAIHPMAVLSPFFRELPLAEHGLEWIQPPASIAHPFDDGTAAMLYRSLEQTARSIAPDGDVWSRMMQPYVRRSSQLFDEVLRPVHVPRHPLLMARFGLTGLQSCASLAQSRFKGAKARALFAGCAAHSFLALDKPFTASFGVLFALTGHATHWPCVRGGTQRLTNALAAYLTKLGGEVETRREIRTLMELPESRVVLFDLAPRAVERIAANALPASYRAKLRAYRHGPGVFKIDWALRGPIPWKAQECNEAATVHLGATFEEIAESEAAVGRGRISDRPFLLVAQQSLFDNTRAPQGAHTGWAYCHVPHGFTQDMTERIERQIDRFAPGFRDLILQRSVMSPADIEAHNPNMIGGDIVGGASDGMQFLFRPFLRWNPYSTPNPRLFLCSSSTAPGGGVHGMCGYWAAQAALAQLQENS